MNHPRQRRVCKHNLRVHNDWIYYQYRRVARTRRGCTTVLRNASTSRRVLYEYRCRDIIRRCAQLRRIICWSALGPERSRTIYKDTCVAVARRQEAACHYRKNREVISVRIWEHLQNFWLLSKKEKKLIASTHFLSYFSYADFCHKK